MFFQGPAFYLAGDSYPGDRPMEETLCRRLRPHLPRLERQADWFGPDPTEGMQPRFDRLSARLAGMDAVVLLGRSSGARLATLLAMRHRPRAVICLGYPFQAPSQVLEPARFAHLADISVPTLILQGILDEYGGAEATERYRLSPWVEFRLLDGVGHDFALPAARWDAVTRMIADFIARADGPPMQAAGRFDEAYYRTRHPDIAAAIARGELASGHVHFLHTGRFEGRRFRVMAEG